MTWETALNLLWVNTKEIIKIAITSGVVYTLLPKLIEQTRNYKYNRKLQTHEGEIEKRKSISEKRFNTEFELYLKINEAFCDMIHAINPVLAIDERMIIGKSGERENDKSTYYLNFSQKTDEAGTLLLKNAPFIRKEFYEAYDELRSMADRQCTEYFQRNGLGPRKTKRCSEKEFEEKEEKLIFEMNTKIKEIGFRLREYLENLDIIQ